MTQAQTTVVVPPQQLLLIAQHLVQTDWQPVWVRVTQSGQISPLEGSTGSAPFPTVLPQPDGPHRLGFRPPPEVVIIDVDHYGDKRGADTIDRAEEWLGELPETWKITSRGYNSPSGRLLFRKPADLDFSDAALSQFADDDGHTHVDILRTGHRFSWAPGDLNPKDGNRQVVCYDPYGEPCLLPPATELPGLPGRWVAYLRNPPVVQNARAYSRPGDGPQWWLSQPDESLGTRAELAGFAFDLLSSRLAPEDAFPQLRRVALALDPAAPWEDSDLWPLLDANTQRKTGEILQRQDGETEYFKDVAGSYDVLAAKAAEAQHEYENRQSLLSAVTQPLVAYDPLIVQQGFERIGYAYDPDEDDWEEDSAEKSLEDRFRGLDSYQRLLFDQLARTQAVKDAAKILAGEFRDYEDIADLPDPEKPCTLLVRGTEKGEYTRLVSPNTVTVISGHRSSGKTWAVATWAAQELHAGNHVIWVDFERQSRLLTQKMRALHIPAHIVRDQLHYTGGVVPPTERLVADVKKWSASGRRVLVVVDAFRGLQGIVSPGTSANDGDAVEAVYLSVLNPVAARDAGGTVVVIDHLSKAGDKGTFGSERKESAADYVIQAEQVKPFSKRQSGFSSLVITKDRYGEIEAGTAAGFLWVPGDDAEPKSDEGIKYYPRIPELRRWSPSGDAQPGDGDTEADRLGRLQTAGITEFVRKNPLKYNQRTLASALCNDNPALYGNAESLRTNVINRKLMKASPPVLIADSSHRLRLADFGENISKSNGNKGADPRDLDHEYLTEGEN